MVAFVAPEAWMTLPLHPRTPRGLSMIELLMFISIVSIALAALLRVFVQATSASADPMLKRQALAIAESLLEEVQLMPYTFCDSEDSQVETATSPAGCNGAAEAIGPETGESRSTLPSFDHVNDYHGLAMTGISDLTGSAVSGLAGYNASVTVATAALNSLTAGSGDALKISVTVTGPGATSVTLMGYRSRHAPNASL
jgi:MSHA pilin protein MshD